MLIATLSQETSNIKTGNKNKTKQRKAFINQWQANIQGQNKHEEQMLRQLTFKCKIENKKWKLYVLNKHKSHKAHCA